MDLLRVSIYWAASGLKIYEFTTFRKTNRIPRGVRPCMAAAGVTEDADLTVGVAHFPFHVWCLGQMKEAAETLAQKQGKYPPYIWHVGIVPQKPINT